MTSHGIMWYHDPRCFYRFRSTSFACLAACPFLARARGPGMGYVSISIRRSVVSEFQTWINANPQFVQTLREVLIGLGILGVILGAVFGAFALITTAVAGVNLVIGLVVRIIASMSAAFVAAGGGIAGQGRAG